MTALLIRFANIADVPVILEFIHKLAEFEKLLDQVTATADGLCEQLFGDHPSAEVLLAIDSGEPVGFALFFHNFSTFVGKRGIYLEDLFVLQSHRGKGVGTALLRRLAEIAVERKCVRMDWVALEWNTGAIRFYEQIGAVCLDDWRVFRLSGEALTNFVQWESSSTFINTTSQESGKLI